MKLNRVKTGKILFLFLSFLLFLWFMMSFIRTFWNLSKIYTERNLIFASDDEKRYEIFGELHSFLTFVEKNTPRNSEINFIVTSKDIDNRFNYLSYYYLYPRRVDFVSENQNITSKNGYIITFGFFKNNKKINNNYSLLNTYVGKKYTGSIYKLK